MAILPVDAPTGTFVTMLVDVLVITSAKTPLKRTRLLDAVLLKLVPEMVTVALSAPCAGLKPSIDGVGKTVKLEALVSVTPPTVMDIRPLVAPAGTVVARLVFVDEVTIAGVPLKVTALLEDVVLKLVPLSVTREPTAP